MFKFSEGMRGVGDYAQTALVPIPYLSTPAHLRKDRKGTTLALGTEGALGSKSVEDGESYLGQAVGSSALRGAVAGAALGGYGAYKVKGALKEVKNSVLNYNKELGTNISIQDGVSEAKLELERLLDTIDSGKLKRYGRQKFLSAVEHMHSKPALTTAAIVGGTAAAVGGLGALIGGANYGVGRAITDGPEIEKNGSEGMRGAGDYAQASLVPLPYLSTPAHIRKNREVATILLGTEGALGSKSVDDDRSYLGQAAGLGALRGAMIGTAGGAVVAGSTISELNQRVRAGDRLIETGRSLFAPGTVDRQVYDSIVNKSRAEGISHIKNQKLKGAAMALGIGAAGGTAIGALMGSGAYGLGRVTADSPEVEKNGSYRAEMLYSKLTR